MTKHWLLSLLVLLLVVSAVSIAVPALYRTSIQPKNFPLERVWVAHLNGIVEAISITDNEIVLVRTTKSLYALTTTSGDELWRFDLSWQAEPEPAVASRGGVYVADGEALWALNQSDGSMLWRQTDIGSNPRITDLSEIYVVVKANLTVYLYDALRGSLILERPGCLGDNSAYIDNHKVYYGCEGVEIIDIPSGEVLLKGHYQGLIGNTDALNGIIYYSPAEPIIEAFDTRTQTRIWRGPCQIDGFERFRVIDDILYFTDFSKICAIHRKNGQILWCTDIFYPQNPTLFNNLMYVFNGNSTIVTALDPKNGDIVGSLTLKNLNRFSSYRELMTSSKDLLFFGSGREVFAFGK